VQKGRQRLLAENAPELLGRADLPTIKAMDEPAEYIDEFYREHTGEIESSVGELSEGYEEIEEVLNSKLAEYFGVEYANIDAVCHPSIFNCNPRYIDSRVFQVFYKKNYVTSKAVFVCVGGVDDKEAVPLFKELLGDVSQGRIPFSGKLPPNPANGGIRTDPPSSMTRRNGCLLFKLYLEPSLSEGGRAPINHLRFRTVPNPAWLGTHSP